MAVLDNWYFVALPSEPFHAPECTQGVFIGTVFGHPKKPDGETVRTNVLLKVEGLTVTTASGTVYELLQPSKEYREFAEGRNPDIDWKNPFK